MSERHRGKVEEVIMAKRKRQRRPSRLTIDVLEARTIVLVDEYGTERASIDCSGGDGGLGGSAVIHLNDDRGRPRLTLQVDSRGNPSVCLFTRGDSPGISLAVNNGHGNGIGIADSQGKPRVELGVGGPESNDPRGTQPDIVVIDEQGQRIWSVFAGTYQMPTVSPASPVVASIASGLE